MFRNCRQSGGVYLHLIELSLIIVCVHVYDHCIECPSGCCWLLGLFGVSFTVLLTFCFSSFSLGRYLISQGAHVGAVNSEGDTPLHIAEEEAMEELLQNEVNRQGNSEHGTVGLCVGHQFMLN